MLSFRQFVRLVSLVVFGAAILLGPTDAKAHAAHKHHAVNLHAVVITYVSDAASDYTSSGQATRDLPLVGSAPASVADVVLQENGKATIKSVRSQDQSPLSHGCVPGCCDDCMACCGIAYSVGSSILLYTARFERVSLLDPASPWQHDPEADRKPPRSIV